MNLIHVKPCHPETTFWDCCSRFFYR